MVNRAWGLGLGAWGLGISHWSIVIGGLEFRDGRVKRSQKLEVRIQNEVCCETCTVTGCKLLVTRVSTRVGEKKSEVGSQNSE